MEHSLPLNIDQVITANNFEKAENIAVENIADQCRDEAPLTLCTHRCIFYETEKKIN